MNDAATAPMMFTLVTDEVVVGPGGGDLARGGICVFSWTLTLDRRIESFLFSILRED